MKSIVTAILLLLSLVSYGWHMSVIEENLLPKFQRVSYWRSFFSGDDKIDNVATN